MRFDAIVELLKRNSSYSQWNHITAFGESIAYCREDVNLWNDFRIVWENQKAFMQIRLFYNSTFIASMPVPVLEAQSAQEIFMAFLNQLSPFLESKRLT